MTLLIIVGAGALVLAALAEVASPGPSRPVVAVSRYGTAPYLVAVLALAGVASWLLLPVWRSTIASVGLLAGIGWLYGCYRYHWLRRTILRGRWVSVARSCGLSRRDVRGSQWPFDATITMGNQRVEWLPTLSRARHVEGVGVRFKLTPARGGSIGDVAEVSEALAAGLRVQRIEITRTSPSKGELLAVYER